MSKEMADRPEPPFRDEDDDDARRRRLQEELGRQIVARYDPTLLGSTVLKDVGQADPLDLGTQLEMERRLGGQFGHVRIFRGPLAEEITRRHSADAVTVANTGMILIREGPRSDPRTALGKALLAHELTHVKQAGEGLQFAKDNGSNAEAEKQAEFNENKTYADELGRGTKLQALEKARGEELRRRVMERVFQLIAERRRLHAERLGGE
jgi:hypothetical protein